MDLNESKKQLQAAIFQLQQNDIFTAGLIQELVFKFVTSMPSAYIGFNKKNFKFEMGINPEFFNKLTPLQRCSILTHEILHFTNKHIFRMTFEDRPEHERKIQNIAADMAINQYIKNLPQGCEECINKPITYDCSKAKEKDHVGKCVDIKDWKDNTGKDLPPFKEYELYYDLIYKSLENKFKKQTDSENEENNDSKDKGINIPGPNDEVWDKYSEFDKHDWERLTEEEKQKMLQEAKNMIKRTLEKTIDSHDLVPGSIRDLMDQIDADLAKMNYKDILRKAIKKTITLADRESTWKRPNKRYGVYAPGNRNASLPSIAQFIDFSGSMSITEINENLRCTDEFLRAGSKKCILGFWHTELFHTQKYKIGQELDSEVFESGGTDPDCVLDYVKKNKPNLNIIYTDGHYDRSKYDKLDEEIIWIISKDGNENHPNAHIGKTIHIKNLKN